MRQQAAGIINNYEFDSIIMGSSMLENTSSVEASRLLGGNFVNISIFGSDFYERKIVLSYALRKKNIKTIVYSLDSVYLDQLKRSVASFSYLYDENRLNDLQVYWNKKFVRCCLSWSKSDECIGSSKTLEYPNAWYNQPAQSMRYGGLNHWFAAKNDIQVRSALSSIVSNSEKINKHETLKMQGHEQDFNYAKIYIDETLLSLVKQYPETKFIMVFPPYSRIVYAEWAQYNLPHYALHKKIVEYLVTQSAHYKNLEIYGFEDQVFLDDISKYKDPHHFHYTINSKMLHWFKSKKGLLDSYNIHGYLIKSNQKALDFNMTKLGNKINMYLKSSIR
jgi:hypothetical protein